MKRRTLINSVLASGIAPIELFKEVFSQEVDRWHQTYDVIIVGAGGAGLAAAAKCSENKDLKILLLEKQSSIGGSTLISGGFLGVVDSKRQKPLGIVDSIEKHYHDIYENGDRKGNPRLIETLVHRAPDMLNWLEAAGMEFQDTIIEIYGSHFARCHIPLSPNGRGYISTLSELAMKNGVEIRSNTPVKDLIKNSADQLVGVRVLDKGSLVNIRALKGVVLTSGGFGSNPQMVASYDERLRGLPSNSSPGSTGEILSMASERVGAALIDMQYIQCLPGVIPGGKIRVRLHNDVSRFVFVDENGRRFVEEDARRDVLSDAVLSLPKKSCYVIVDDEGVATYDPLVRRDAIRGIETGDAFKAYSLGALAKKLSLPENEFIKSIEQYNQKLAAVPKNRYPIKKEPFWAAKTGMCIHYTMGGIAINEKAQCLDTQGEVIQGLYAAGECTGGVHGKNRIGANGICDALTFGMIAGEELLA